jgi:Ni,Fe-hydrogenase III small subunit
VACPSKKISFTEGFKMASDSREGLVVQENMTDIQVKTSEKIKAKFGRSLKLRSVSAGGCNGCEMELSALSNVNFDISRFGIDFVASPRHSDGLVITGPMTQNMSKSIDLAYEGMPDLKFVIAVGACAISGGLYEDSPTLNREFLNRIKPHLYIPGCPPHPLTFVNGILDLLGRF